MKLSLALMICFSLSAFAGVETLKVTKKRLPNPKVTSLLCTANYLVRELKQIYGEGSGGLISNLEMKTISSISIDFSRAIAGGGGDVMGDKIKLREKDKIVISYPNQLKDPRGMKLQAIGGFNNGYENYKKKKREYSFDVTFYPHDNAATGTNVSPEFVIVGEGTKIAEVRENEFIQVSCNYVKRFQFPKEKEEN